MSTIRLISVLSLALPFTVGDPTAAAAASTTAIGTSNKGWSNSINAGGWSTGGTYTGTAPATPAKYAPGYLGGPQFILWSAVPHISSPAWANKRIVMRARCDASSQQWFTGGTVGDPAVAPVPAPYNTDAVMGGNYNVRNSTTDLADITAGEKAIRNTQICRWVARTFADRQYYQGLIRGRGYAKGGLAGGCLDLPFGFTHHGVGTGAAIARKFSTLMSDPRDACAKAQLVAISGGTRTITLPNRDYNGQIPAAFSSAPSPQTAANVAGLEALTFSQQQTYGVRHTGYNTMFIANGIAENVALNTELATLIRAQIDHYVPYGMTDADAVELCEPAICLVDNEEGVSRLHGVVGSFYTTANGHAIDYYERIGNYFNAREDARYDTEVICRGKSGDDYTVDKTFRDLITDDAFLATYDSALAPAVTANIGLSIDQIYAFDRINQNVIAHGIKMCLAPLVAAFDAMAVTNYDSMEIEDFADPFVRVGGGWVCHQSLNPLDYDSPSCYGRTVGSQVNAIKAAAIAADAVALAAAVAAWDATNLTDVKNVTDKVATGRPVAPYLFGPSDPQDLADGTEIDYGGSKAFFKEIVLDKVSKGMLILPIYGGNHDLIIEAIEELCDEQGW